MSQGHVERGHADDPDAPEQPYEDNAPDEVPEPGLPQSDKETPKTDPVPED